jgi:hypothetical protein
MSRPYLRWDSGLDAWVPGGTIGFHRDLLAWIPPDGTVRVAEGTTRTLRIEPATETVPADVLLVRIPIPGSGDFYTVEARTRAGYDSGLVTEAVLIHRVPDPDGPDCTLHRCAVVMTGAGQSDPNGPSAVWRPGEVFTDGFVSVAVRGETERGWELEVSVNVPERPAGLSLARAAAALLDGLELSAEEIEYLDLLGNRNGRYDLGDFLAFAGGRP